MYSKKIHGLKFRKKFRKCSFWIKRRLLLTDLNHPWQISKKLKPEFFSPFDDSKKLVGESHAKLLQIFYLDRENEELLVKLNQPLDRQSFNRFSVGPDEIDPFIHNRD